MKMYKLTKKIDIKKIKKIKGKEATILNPVQDINGDWFISKEEYDGKEFEYLKSNMDKIFLESIFEEYIPPIDIHIDEYGNPTTIT